MQEDVLVAVKNGVARITLQRSEKGNALSSEIIEKIIKICDALQWENENDVQLCAIEGKGDFFCSGIDFEEISERKTISKEEFFEEALNQARLLRQIASLPCPVLAKVKGGALGLGLGFVAVSDYVVAEEDSIFGTPEIKIGLPPVMESLYLNRKCGFSNSSLFSLSGEMVSVKEAISMGLVNRSFAKESFDKECEKIEGNFLECGPQALRKMKNLLLKISPVPNSEVEEFAAMQLSEAFDSKEFKEGIAALKQKRIPKWIEGR